jgi:hypothetical protein
MKITTRRVMGMVGAMMAFCLIIGISSSASAAVKGLGGCADNPTNADDGCGDSLDKGYCTIYSGNWDHISTPDGGFSLRKAAYLLNHPDRYEGTCTKQITLAAKVVAYSPLVIAKGGDADSPLVIDGAGNTLDVSKMAENAKTDGEDGHACAIYVGTSNVVIKNLRISAGEKKVDVVCLNGAANKISNVFADGAKNGIVFKETAQSNRILPDVMIQQATDYGILDLSSGSAPNVVIMTSQKGMVNSAKNDVVDQYGMLKWDTATMTDAAGNVITGPAYYSIADLMLSGEEFLTGAVAHMDDGTDASPYKLHTLGLAGSEAQGLLKSVRNIVPVITNVHNNGSQWVINGEFMTVDATDPVAGEAGVSKQIDCKTASLAGDGKASRLALYTVESGERVFKGIVGMSSGLGVDKDGTFKFYMQGSQGSTIILVPITSGWELIGRASNVTPLAEGQTDCLAGTAPAGGGNTGNTGGGTTTGSLGNVKGYVDQTSCDRDHDYRNGIPDRDTDSDGDRIPDFIEMSIQWKDTNGDGTADNWVFDPIQQDVNGIIVGGANCNCNGKLSCWNLTDTDHDGVVDSFDGKYSWNKFSNMEGTEPLADRILQPGVDISDVDAAYDPLGINSYRAPDVADLDRDKDAKWDGEEDRSRLFISEAKAHYWFGFGINTQPYVDKNYKQVECTLSAVKDQKVGVNYGVYIAGGTGENHIDSPKPFNFASPDGNVLVADQGYYMLVCLNDSLDPSTSFNGAYEESEDFSNADTVDSDADCVCDGDGIGCTGGHLDGMTSSWQGNPTCLNHHGGQTPVTAQTPQWLNDGCNDRMAETNACAPKCHDGEMLKLVQRTGPQYVAETDGDSLKLVDSDSDGIPDIFEQKKTWTEDVTLGNGEHFSVAMEQPDYELVMQICGDMDKDGIPNCVEQPEYRCPTISAGRLDAYNADSDGDGLIDGFVTQSAQQPGTSLKEDVCPKSHEMTDGQDVFSSAKPIARSAQGYSCDPLQVYTDGVNDKIVACYLDRDGDSIRDCIEDKNADGQLASPPFDKNTQENIIKNVYLSESSPMMVDTDADSLTDTEEITGNWGVRTNPHDIDTDGDHLEDLGTDNQDHRGEDRNRDHKIQPVTDQSAQGCGASQMLLDTDPRNPDTDGDGLKDGDELSGAPMLIDPKGFQDLLYTPATWQNGGISSGSNPNAKDSDGDGLPDGEEYNGHVITYWGANPCLQDSDGDTRMDDLEPSGCRLNKDARCVASDPGKGMDSDGDALSDDCEVQLGTDAFNWDSDGDGVKDGDEDSNHNCKYEPNLSETNPIAPDTDVDGLNDGLELKYGTDPTNADTDGDCIPDGTMAITAPDGTAVQSTGEDANVNGQWDVGETNALSWDTDGDGLPDGWIASMGMGEDLNCNGIRERDASGNWIETDPRNPDSNMNGESDYDEMTRGGAFNISNVDGATNLNQGCSLVATGVDAMQVPFGAMYAMAASLILAAVRIGRRKQ